ncbi:MAG: 30S ribosomal protein S7 [Candidatus Aureabacteria bacterium]|nr:30S ribosomal protein S7 [Candidatus Auribacterota bacterium]
MSRRRRVIKKRMSVDSKFNSPLVARFITGLMSDGKKSIAERIFYSSLDLIGKQVQDTPPIKVLEKAVERVKPYLEVKSRRVGGATYQVPVEVRPERQVALAIRWIVGYSRARKGKPMQERLAAELLEAYKGEGASIKKREDTHKMAEANKAFAHYRW